MKDLTKLLKASIQLENKAMNKLTDFPPDVLRAMFRAVLSKGDQLKTHVEHINDYGVDMRRLMAGELIEISKEIELLDTAEIQLATAIAIAERNEKANQN